VTTAVASAVWDILSDPAFLAEIRRKGELLETLLASGLESIGVAGEVRGAGLLRGLRLNDASYDGAWCSAVIAAARDSGLIILKTGSDVLRLAPPLVINDDEIAEGVTILFDIIRKKLTKNKG
jgi:acetylornithine/N-succinyldiaminopimelate aminotransferase